MKQSKKDKGCSLTSFIPEPRWSYNWQSQLEDEYSVKEPSPWKSRQRSVRFSEQLKNLSSFFKGEGCRGDDQKKKPKNGHRGIKSWQDLKLVAEISEFHGCFTVLFTVVTEQQE